MAIEEEYHGVLELNDVHAYYADSHVLHGVTLSVKQGEIVSLLGRNGAGKTTTLLTIMGYLPAAPGRISYNGNDLKEFAPYENAKRGFGFVPQERGIFASLTVQENLTVAAIRRSGRWTLREIYALFPRLQERQTNLGSQLSGGEQQMLSIGRALMLNPELILLDEPSEGIAPIIVEEIAKVLRQIKHEGVAILLVEQNLRLALDLGDRHYVMSKGQTCFTGTSEELENNSRVLSEYLSV